MNYRCTSTTPATALTARSTRTTRLVAAVGAGLMAATMALPLPQALSQPAMPEAPASAPASITLDVDNSRHTHTNAVHTPHTEQTQKGKGIYELFQAGNTPENRLMKERTIKIYGICFIVLATLMFVYSRIKEWYRRGIEDMPELRAGVGG